MKIFSAFVKLMSPLLFSGEIATDEVNHLFAGADEDVDGILSAAEIVKNHDLFVGSEATDYGEHLHNPNRLDDEL